VDETFLEPINTQFFGVLVASHEYEQGARGLFFDVVGFVRGVEDLHH
jgi:hypothetical protein